MSTAFQIFLGKAPFLKILLPLMAGIAVADVISLPLPVSVAAICAGLVGAISTSMLPPYLRLRAGWLKVIFLQLLWLAMGVFLYQVRDTRFDSQWFGHRYTSREILVTSLTEAPVEKTNSYKADADVVFIKKDERLYKTSGKIILYFAKNSDVRSLQPGISLAFGKTLQPIKNSGNPGSFDYENYALRNGITHQVFLTADDYVISAEPAKASFGVWLHRIRAKVVRVIKANISGAKEQGLAMALLIGYKNELDKDLQQAYANTGIVHVIAISGMHLALVFWVLNLLFGPLLKNRKTKWLHPVLVLLFMWLFTLLAGASASVTRAAVMFTFIIVGKSIGRQGSVYNSLALSAFVLLCYHPYWLWNVGFQLSFAAVLSIVVFFRPIYHLVFFRNKTLDWLWTLLAVSISAQILTTPIAIYHFHRFPVYFLITNLLVVPVASLVLVGELALVLLSPIAAIAGFLGKILSALIWWMNSFIETLSGFPLAVWERLQINGVQVFLLYLAIAAFGFLLIGKRKTGMWVGLAALAGFMSIRAVSFYLASQQRKMIVYQVSRHTAISFINGRQHLLLADPDLLKDKRLFSMNIEPAIIRYRLKPVKALPGLDINKNQIRFLGENIIVINAPPAQSILTAEADLVILSGNPRLYISQLRQAVPLKKIIIGSNVPARKARYWKKDCDSLRISCFDVNTQGAFEYDLR